MVVDEDGDGDGDGAELWCQLRAEEAAGWGCFGGGEGGGEDVRGSSASIQHKC